MKNAGKKIFWTVFFILLAGLAVVIYVIPGAETLLARTSVIEYGEIILKTETDAYFVREENVYAESGSGAAYFFEEGARVRRDSTLFQTGASLIKAEATGVVSYYVDGLEKSLTPETMATYPRESLESFFAGENAPKGPTSKIKLVSEETWYLLFWADTSDAGNYETGKTVSVTFGEEQPVQMTVLSAQAEESGVRIILRSNRYSAVMEGERKVKAVIVTSDRTGLLLRNSAIGYSDNMQGVWVKQVTGDFAFVPVNVLSTDGTYSIVSEGSFTRVTTEGGTAKQTTVNAYDEILNVPPKAE